jgi:hypothetical protein
MTPSKLVSRGRLKIFRIFATAKFFEGLAKVSGKQIIESGHIEGSQMNTQGDCNTGLFW